MFGMNPVQIEGQIKVFLGFFGGVATVLGWTWWDPLSNAFLATIGPVLEAVGPLTYFGAAVWSIVSKRNANIVSNAAAVPGVQHITLTANPAGRALESATPGNVSVTSPNPRTS